MADLWTSLIPLIVAGALLPVQIIITVLLLRSAAGRITAVAWVAGMTTVRLAQGLVFGLLLGEAESSDAASGGPGTALSLLLLVLAVVFYVTAARYLLKQPEEDAPPPRWAAMIDGIRPGRAYLLGVGLLAVNLKLWVFTLGAIAAIADAGLERGASIVTFLLFVALTEAIHLLVLGIAYALPDRSTVLLGQISSRLERSNRAIMVALGLVFGTWFLVKSLSGLGVI